MASIGKKRSAQPPRPNLVAVGSLMACQAAEWQAARTVLLCEPRLETALGLLVANAQNFPRPFGLEAAQVEHRRFREALEARGVTVVDLRDALSSACHLDDTARETLVEFTRKSIRFAFAHEVDLMVRDQVRSDALTALRGMSPEQLVEFLLLRPAVHIANNRHRLDETTALDSRFTLRALTNAYYMRDPLITTGAGCTIGRLRLVVRRHENEVAKHALLALGIQPFFRVHAPGTLEGGDFIPCGDFVLQGQGLLTNAEGVAQCLAARAYGRVEVGVVRDERAQMDEMHLDCYLAVFDRDLCALCDDRMGEHEPFVDVYEPSGGSDFAYRLTSTVRLRLYLESKGMRVLSFSTEQRDGFAANGLLVGPRRYLCPAQSGDEWIETLRKAGVEVEVLDFAQLTGGYGGPHCSSQVLVRG
jgi:arginine deiminase